MDIPTKLDLQAAGYRVSVNIADAVVARCAEDVKTSYLLPCVSSSEIDESDGKDAIGEAWRSLTALRLMQDCEFATRVGGEKKRLSYGDHLTDKRQAKTRAAMAMDALKKAHPATGEVRDICEVWFRTQLML